MNILFTAETYEALEDIREKWMSLTRGNEVTKRILGNRGSCFQICRTSALYPHEKYDIIYRFDAGTTDLSPYLKEGGIYRCKA